MSEDRHKNMNMFNFDFNSRNTQNFPLNQLNFNPEFSNLINMNMAHNFNNQLINGKRHREEIREMREKCIILFLLLANVQNVGELDNLMVSKLLRFIKKNAFINNSFKIYRIKFLIFNLILSRQSESSKMPNLFLYLINFFHTLKL